MPTQHAPEPRGSVHGGLEGKNPESYDLEGKLSFPKHLGTKSLVRA